MSGISNYSFYSNMGQNTLGADTFIQNLNKSKDSKGATAKGIKNEAVKSGIKSSVKTGSTSTIASGIELSDAAKSMLEKLKEKYDGVDFFVANYETDEEAQKYLSQGSKDYSVLIEPDLLEKMAADEDEAAKYDEIIASSLGQLDDMREQLGEDGKDVKSLGITVSGDGSVKYFAELEKSSERQREAIEKARAEKKEEAKEKEKADEKKAAKDALAEKVAENADMFHTSLKTTVSGSSIEELIENIKAVDWSKITPQARPQAGSFINYGV